MTEYDLMGANYRPYITPGVLNIGEHDIGHIVSTGADRQRTDSWGTGLLETGKED